MTRHHAEVNLRDVEGYFAILRDCLAGVEVTNNTGARFDVASAFNQIMVQARSAHDVGNKLIFVGNGGSAAIASHMATDYSKNADVRSLALNDASMVTCLANDLGYERLFAKQIELHGRPGDLLVAISSSGRSPSILNAVAAARNARCAVVTFSGFEPDFHVASDRYGFVEISHLTICHAILDFLCRLRGA
jgi:D-sedoheptulose 7-phosphate isomerase